MAQKKKTKSKASKVKASAKTSKTGAKSAKAKAQSAKKTAKPAKKAAKSAKPKTTAKANGKGSSKKANGKKVVAKKAQAKTANGKKAPKATKKTATSSAAPAKAKKAFVAKEKSKTAKVKETAVSKKKEAPELEVEIPLVEDVGIPGVPEEAEVILTDSEGRRYCRVKDCDQIATVDAYCRYHYLLFWKKIQIRKKILEEGKLEKYIEELTARYPDKYLDMLRKDLRSEKEFLAAIQELEIDDSNDENMDEEDSQSFIEEVRGISESSGRDDEY